MCKAHNLERAQEQRNNLDYLGVCIDMSAQRTGSGVDSLGLDLLRNL